MLSPELQAKIKYLQLKASHHAQDVLSGEYKSSFRGRGMEFDEVRAYQPGDDVRAIDWNVTARMNEPHIKVFREEREMTLMIMLDVSASQHLKSSGRSKLEVSAEIAAILAFLATRNNDKVGLILFGGAVVKYIPPRKGRGHIWQIIQAIMSDHKMDRATALSSTVKDYLKRHRRRQLCVLISDFLVPESELEDLRLLGLKHNTLAIQVRDPIERELPKAGLVFLKDLESGERRLVNTSAAGFRESYLKKQADFYHRVEQGMRLAGIHFGSLTTQDEPVELLQKLLHEHALRRQHP